MKHSLPKAKRTSTRTKALVTGGLVALTAAGVGGAAFASFTGSTYASQRVGSGTVSLDGIGTNDAGNRLTVPRHEIAPGDTIQRAVTITTTGTVDHRRHGPDDERLDELALDTDTVDGLQMTIDKCSVAWTETTIPYTYTCGGAASTVLATTPVIGSNLALSNLDPTPPPPTTCRVTLDPPGRGRQHAPGLDSTIDYTFTGIQRAGTNQ